VGEISPCSVIMCFEELWNFRWVENERQPCVEHNLYEMVNPGSELWTDGGTGFFKVMEVTCIRYAGHKTVNHKGVIDEKTGIKHHFKNPEDGTCTNQIEGLCFFFLVAKTYTETF